ncbi:hypothetical protein QE152_g5502 [Popillia japonica]|uniref:Uncharacterized protein n=1 Tax=Popillia japonica TaxID=7064 RepID=A0AAW1MIH2_POPJA
MHPLESQKLDHTQRGVIKCVFVVENPSSCDVGMHPIAQFIVEPTPYRPPRGCRCAIYSEYFEVIDMVNGLSRWNQLPIDHPAAVEEANEYGFDLGLALGSFDDSHCWLWRFVAGSYG